MRARSVRCSVKHFKNVNKDIADLSRNVYPRTASTGREREREKKGKIDLIR